MARLMLFKPIPELDQSKTVPYRTVLSSAVPGGESLIRGPDGRRWQSGREAAPQPDRQPIGAGFTHALPAAWRQGTGGFASSNVATCQKWRWRDTGNGRPMAQPG